jgi:hypothetical protein
MRHPLRWSLLGGFIFLNTFFTLHAQFYAPATEYHDSVQRVFPIEAARVLAWWSDPEQTNITEVSFDVITKPDQSSVWDIRWLNGAGKTVKSATVSYSTNLLKAGPEFYRSVFKQLWQTDWKKPAPVEAEKISESFWRGATGMGLSREATLKAAFVLANKKESYSDGRWRAELAGLLTHTALPGYAAALTLDKMLLARGAAWLAFAESSSTTPSDGLWAPILFQAGRERTATDLWQKSKSAPVEKQTPQQQGWTLWMRKPTSREVFLFATNPTNLPMAMPVLTYDVLVNATGDALAELIQELAGSPRRLTELHNYAPLFASRSGVGGGHILNGAWALYQRLAWLQLLSGYSLARNDYTGYTKLLSEAKKGMEKLPKEEIDEASLMGFRECAPLLNLAPKEGVGKLIPTPVATARDLLNYGWEMTGWQMGCRYRFVYSSWGVRDLAETIYKPVTTQIDGLMPFFKRGADINLATYDASLKRLQMVEGLFQMVGFSRPAVEGPGPEAARMMVKRCWLRPKDLEWQVRSLYDDKHIPDIPVLLTAYHSEGGSLAAAFATIYLLRLNNEALAELPNGQGIQFSIAESLPQPTYMKMRVTFERKHKNLDDFKKGQELEKLYWQNPDSDLEGRVLIYYIEAGAYKSLRRFYSQARSNFLDPVKFSNGSGPQLFVVGYCLNDRKLREQAIEDSSSASQMDMMLHLWEAAIEDKPKEIEEWANQIVERYEQNEGVNSLARRLLKFLPLLPALRDAKHASHREALEFFGKDQGWTILRFIWIEKFKLPVSEAITFLGGKENSLLNQFLISYLEKDLQQDALQQLSHSNARTEQKMLGYCLFHKLHPVPKLQEDADLKPPGAASIREAVLERTKRN